MFENGERVLCVKPPGPWFRVPTGEHRKGPQRGHICTVIGGQTASTGKYYLNLGEWPNEDWEAAHFRPIKKTQTDISVFTALLDKLPPGRPVRRDPVDNYERYVDLHGRRLFYGRPYSSSGSLG
jgi:hypothetical protein